MLAALLMLYVLLGKMGIFFLNKSKKYVNFTIISLIYSDYFELLPSSSLDAVERPARVLNSLFPKR